MFKIIGKKDEKKGFSIDSLIEIANEVKIKIKDLIGLKNGDYQLAVEEHDISEDTEFELGNVTKYKLSDLVNQEIDVGNGKKEKLIDLVKSGRIKLAAAKTDDGEESEEAKAKKKEEYENAIKNCGCNGKEDGDHKKECPMYNATKMKNETAEEKAKREKDEEFKNAREKVTALENEVKALKEGIVNADSFVKVSNARREAASSEAVILQNGTLEANTMEAGLNRARAYFGPESKN